MPYRVSGADGAEDYTAPSGPLTIRSGVTTGTIVISTKSDQEDESGESVTVELLTPEHDGGRGVPGCPCD